MGAKKRAYRWYRVPEDAGDAAWIRVGNPPDPWNCDWCQTHNEGHRKNCAYCGRANPDDD